MKIFIDENGTWFHGSDKLFSVLKKGSTVTQWKELAEAFSCRPTLLSYDDSGRIEHNGVANGFLYVVDEPVSVGVDVLQHPRSTMDLNAEFVTNRNLKVKLIGRLLL